MINNLGNFNIKEAKQKGLQVSDLDQKKTFSKDFGKDKDTLETPDTLKETIGVLKNSIAAQRTDRVSYDMTNLHNHDDDLKFL